MFEKEEIFSTTYLAMRQREVLERAKYFPVYISRKGDVFVLASVANIRSIVMKTGEEVDLGKQLLSLKERNKERANLRERQMNDFHYRSCLPGYVLPDGFVPPPGFYYWGMKFDPKKITPCGYKPGVHPSPDGVVQTLSQPTAPVADVQPPVANPPVEEEF